jgi:hypothetical protein
MKHIMTGDWQLQGKPEMVIEISKVIQLINYRKLEPVELDIDCIAYKELDSIDTKEARYIVANTNYAGIVVEGMENPYNKKYRLIDGRHRLLKTMKAKKDTFKVYVLQTKDIDKFYQVL